jgi:K+-transporting ATPase ATPase A chain
VISLSYLLSLLEKFAFFSDENPVLRLLKIIKISTEEMTWKEYFLSLLFINFLVVIISGIILVTSLNPGYYITPSLLFNTLSSFITNTDLEHFASEFMFKPYGEAFALQFIEWIAPATGLSVAISFIRSITYGKIGNFFRDLLSSLILVLFPLSLLLSILYMAMGTPQTFFSFFNLPEPAGPLSSLLPIMTLGNNGGSYYMLGSAITFQNPNIFTNFLQSISMLIFPFSLFWLFGLNIKNKKEGLSLLMASLLIFLSMSIIVLFEHQTLFPFRIGDFSTKILTLASMFSNTGLVSAPLSRLSSHALTIYIIAMVIAMSPGSIGTGFLNIEIYTILTIFFISLMAGRMPEYLYFKLNIKEIKLSSLAFLLHPLLIYVGILIMPFILPRALFPHIGNSFTQALWEIISSTENNGSDFYGTLGNFASLNYLTGILMILGRYLFLMLALLIANEFIKKKKSTSFSKIRTDTFAFSVSLVIFIFLLVIITLLPLLVLGPMANW